MKLKSTLNIHRLLLPLLTLLLLTPALTSCFDDDNPDDYTEWKEENEQYVDRMEATGNYERITPVWAPGLFTLIKYHSRPANYASAVHPLSTSTVDIKYRGMLMDSTVFDTSYTMTTYGDSIYRCRPNQLVDGFWAALTEMVPGDSVTVIIPAQAGYGVTGSSGIKPYSTLIFDIKLKKIVKFDY